MCDAIVAVGKATKNGTVIFGKNSDRSPNESQPLVHYLRQKYKEGSKVKCQFIEIPQTRVTFEVVGSQPYWLWGFEHGLNEFDVAIGNMAVQSKEPFEVPEGGSGLLGMDLVRLGLERGKTAYEAMHVITDLLETYGPGASSRARYHNNYLIADPKEAWVLETAGRYWVAERVTDGVRAVGNLYSIQTQWSECHPELVDHAVEKGWCISRDDFNFAKDYCDYEKNPITGSLIRWRRASALLKEHEGEITIEVMMEILRDHREDTFLQPLWTPGEDFYASLCCHERPWGSGQTAASMVVELREDMPRMLRASCWMSMTPPCTSVFRPFYLKGVKIPSNLSVGGREYSTDSPWWTFKKLQRHVERNYSTFAPIIRNIWKEVERLEHEQLKVIERKVFNLLKNGKTESAISILQRFVDRNSEDTLKMAKQLDNLLYHMERIVPKYKDLREPYLKNLNKEANLKI